jgi:hypothetical protein
MLAQRGQELDTHEFAKATLESVSIDGRMTVARDHNPNARMRERGSEDPDIEVHGPKSLPLSNDGLQVGAPCQPVATRESKARVRRLRTCLAT